MDFCLRRPTIDLMANRVVGSIGLLAVALSVAIGPGLSINRCLMTGEVTLSCCCAAETASGAGSVAAGDSCCSIERLEAPWNHRQVPSQSALDLGAPMPGAFTALLPVPASLAWTERPSVQYQGPPLWLTTAALRI